MKWQNESFFELSQDLLFVIDFDNIILEVNSACDKILSREKEEVIQLPVLELIHPQDITLTLNEFSNNLNNGKSTNFICRFLHKDSSYRWMNLNVSVDFKNKLKYVVARDITDSRNAEDELHRVFNNIPALIGHWDKNLINKFANTGYADLLDNSPENIKGKHIKDILHDRTYQKNISFINRVLAGESQVFEREKILEDGSLRHIFVRYIPDIKENSVVGFFVVATDITVLKNLEKERRDTETKLIASAKMSSLGEMAGGIAHEINNPLSIIYGKTGQIKRKLESKNFDLSNVLNELSKIEIMSDRISKIVKGLLSFSRNSDEDTLSPCSIVQIIEDTLELCSEKFRHSGIQIDLKFEENIQIECRASQISQVIMNLLNNAYDAVEKLDDRWIEIKTILVGQFLTLTITDSGSGISQNIQEKIMQPFYTTKEIGKGTGLGLSISKGLVEKHQGTLVYDQSCENTRFIVSLPVKQSYKEVKSA